MVHALLPHATKVKEECKLLHCVRPVHLRHNVKAAAIVMSNTASALSSLVLLSAHSKATRMVAIHFVPFYSHTYSSTPP